MLASLDMLRPFGFWTVLLRLILAVICGCVIGCGRTKRQRPAGIRTYTLIAIGAALSVIITLYLYEMLQTQWADTVAQVGEKFDAARLAAQTISGIGFLGAGIIFKIVHAQVSGLTTATGLFATVCLGLAAGAGFYELVLLTVVLIVLVLNVMAPLERTFKRRRRNMTMYVEFRDVDDISAISGVMDELNAHIYDIDIERTEASEEGYPAAVFDVRLSKENHSHSSMLTSVAVLPGVVSVQELIS